MNAIDNLLELPKETWKKIYKAREVSWKNFGRKIYFFIPGFTYYSNKYFRSSWITFPSISITGSHCSLNCSHCGGVLLRTMIPAQSPNKLVEICSEIKRRGAIGCLISGGCLPNGSVPISRFINAIAEVKNRLGLTVVVHTGLIDFETAKRLKRAGVDAVSIDIIGSEETIREIYHLNVSVEKYAESLDALNKAEIPFTPHVLIGLHYGKLKGEFEALKIISKYDPSALILIVFFPIKGTEMELIKPPSPKVVIDVLTEARFLMPNVPIALGCARPKGVHRTLTDVLAVEAGVNAIAFPSVEAVDRAKKLGLEISFSQVCCSEVYRLVRLGV